MLKKHAQKAAFNAIYFRNKNAFLLQNHSRGKTSARSANEFMWHSLCTEVYIFIYTYMQVYGIQPFFNTL